MPSPATSIAACLVVQGDALPTLDADVRALAAVADEVVVYDTADHLAPGTPVFEAALRPGVTVVSGAWAEDRDRAQEAALAHVRADWALCVLAGERASASVEELRSYLAAAGDAVALSVRVDDVVRGTHRSARLLHRGRAARSAPGAVHGGVELPGVPSRLLAIHQPVATTARLPRQRGIFDRV
ncbi:hypothetical protein CLV92_1079 [Kineococcus xinjiangensis]|uniref:Glycosyl transferase family 2 n=1 Tax=Kineococcus xinjiangensis TaxID=512762 RepID=A0A2S6IJV1_9ACTN|nr:hypothetical protein [Kineococcus xinjiangensis]PPK94507.1 hypothetical protein CLV92_1079 [Kineococcus xinjiangensis]